MVNILCYQHNDYLCFCFTLFYFNLTFNNLLKLLSTLQELVTLTANNNINNVWNTFNEKLQESIDKCVPTKPRRRKPPHEPAWFNLTAKRACSKQRRLYDKCCEICFTRDSRLQPKTHGILTIQTLDSAFGYCRLSWLVLSTTS